MSWRKIATGTQLRDKLDRMTGTSIVYEPEDFLACSSEMRMRRFYFLIQTVQSARGGLSSDAQEISMSRKEPKSAKNMSAQEAVENLFHPKASGNAKKHAEGVKKPRKKSS
jgi:hypothetical protein